VEPAEQQRFLRTVDSLPDLERGALGALNLVIDQRALARAPATPPGIFR